MTAKSTCLRGQGLNLTARSESLAAVVQDHTGCEVIFGAKKRGLLQTIVVAELECKTFVVVVRV